MAETSNASAEPELIYFEVTSNEERFVHMVFQMASNTTNQFLIFVKDDETCFRAQRALYSSGEMTQCFLKNMNKDAFKKRKQELKNGTAKVWIADRSVIGKLVDCFSKELTVFLYDGISNDFPKQAVGKCHSVISLKQSRHTAVNTSDGLFEQVFHICQLYNATFTSPIKDWMASSKNGDLPENADTMKLVIARPSELLNSASTLRSFNDIVAKDPRILNLMEAFKVIENKARIDKDDNSRGMLYLCVKMRSELDGQYVTKNKADQFYRVEFNTLKNMKNKSEFLRKMCPS